MEKRTPNDLNTAVPKFCLALEEFRRTNDGRVRTSQELLQHFFPHDQNKVTDRMFRYLPNEVRGPVLTTWGLRGAKSALKDTDEKVQSVVWDALLAGDIDHEAFEQAITHDIIVRWVPLGDWWAFWRAGKLSKLALLKALDTAYELALFDAKWFFDTIEGPGGKLRGTDVVSEGLTKAELTEWVRKIHASGDGSPKGMLAAIGWDRVVGKTPNDVLVKVLDAFAIKVKLVEPAAAEKDKEKGPGSDAFTDERPSTRVTPVPPAPGLEFAEPAIQNAPVPVVAVSAPPAGIVSVPPRKESISPASEDERMVDALFSESQIPPNEDAEEMIVVDDDLQPPVASSPGKDDNPTNRPPPSVEPEPLMLNKPRPSVPSMPKVPVRR
jgi:hypothetical protein